MGISYYKRSYTLNIRLLDVDLNKKKINNFDIWLVQILYIV